MMWKRIGLALGLVAVLVVGAVAASAQTSDPTEDAATTKTPSGEQEAEEKGFDDEFDEHLGGGLEEGLTEELVAELNAETDALVTHLSALGFTVEVESFEIRQPVFDEEDEAIWQAIDDFYEAQFAAEVAEWSDEEKAEWNAEVDELVALLAEEGITAETTEIAPGVRDLVWTEEIETALWKLEKDFDDCEDFDDMFEMDLLDDQEPMADGG